MLDMGNISNKKFNLLMLTISSKLNKLYTGIYPCILFFPITLKILLHVKEISTLKSKVTLANTPQIRKNLYI